MKNVSLLAMLLLGFAPASFAQTPAKAVDSKVQPKVEVNPPVEKILNPAEHDSKSGMHYGQVDFGKSTYKEPENNRTVGGREIEAERALAEKAKKEAPALMVDPARATQLTSTPQVHVPVYERQTTFNSYLYGYVQNIAITHTSLNLLTSSLDYPAGDLMIDVGKQSENNVRAYALVIRLNDGSLTSVFQADRGEGFKMGDRVRAPIILNQSSFIIGLFKKY